MGFGNLLPTSIVKFVHGSETGESVVGLFSRHAIFSIFNPTVYEQLLKSALLMPTCIFVVNEKQMISIDAVALSPESLQHVKGTFRQENILTSIKNNTKPCIALKENIYAIIICV